jgi:hypothetical protein
LFDENIVITSYDDYSKSFETSLRYVSNKDKKSKMSIIFLMLSENNLKYMQYCKKAYRIDEFSWRMLYRKADKVVQYFQTYNIVDKYSEIDDLYKSDLFAEVSKSWSDDIAKLKASVDLLPKKDNYNILINKYRETLSNYFDLSNIVMTKEQQEVAKQIDNVLTLQEVNENILKHINLPYSLNTECKELITMLQKVMIL